MGIALGGRRRRGALVGLRIGSRPGRGGGRAAAKNGFAEIAEKTAVFLALLGALSRRRLKFGDAVRRSLQGLLLDQYGLR